MSLLILLQIIRGVKSIMNPKSLLNLPSENAWYRIDVHTCSYGQFLAFKGDNFDLQVAEHMESVIITIPGSFKFPLQKPLKRIITTLLVYKLGNVL
ncbi:hypothetical protein Avbf_17112 [Armadillidium vulgare]|nr:hypothetical protein Avbf_17112 [Armadillidium vulgare]